MSAEYDDLSRFSSPSVDTTPAFMKALEVARRQRSEADWREFTRVSPVLRQWRFFLTHDPYTRWGLIKPRGYPGDATLMDFAYRHPSVEPHIAAAGDLGRSIYQATLYAPQSQSARERVALMRKKLIEAGASTPLRIVSLACGHARELEGLSSDDVIFEQITFLDNDPRSLAIASSVTEPRITIAQRCNVVKDPLPAASDAHVVYAMGLFDYLNDAYAVEVTKKMLALLRPGGLCVIGNLDPSAANLGYCEAIMDWWMVVRDADALRQVGEAAAAQSGGHFICDVEQTGCFNYLSIRRA